MILKPQGCINGIQEVCYDRRIYVVSICLNLVNYVLLDVNCF